MSKIIVIGAGYAGMYATLRMAGKLKHNAQITLINASDTFTERIRLHQIAANNYVKEHSIPRLLRGKNVHFVTGMVNQIDLNKRRLRVQTSSGEQWHDYDQLLYALGSSIDRAGVPGVPEYAYTLSPNGERSAPALQAVLPQIASHGGHLVVCGGGLTGIEAVAEFAEQFPSLRVTLVTADRLGERLSGKAQTYLRDVFAKLNITIRDKTAAHQIHADKIELENGETLAYDAVLWAGAFSVPKLAQQSGLAVNAMGQVKVDAYMRSISHPEVYAGGDSAAIVDRPPLRMACGTAIPKGVGAANNIIALYSNKPQQVFTFKYVSQCISLGRNHALVQFTRADDSPVERILTGKLAARVKEAICRGTVATMNAERLLPGIVRWPGQNQKIDFVVPEREVEYRSV